MTTSATNPTSSTSPFFAGSASTAQSTNIAGSSALAGNFDTFLQLLTTQLQNQNPLDPLDTNQFTQQLVEFASVEQQVNMNSNLQTMITMQQTQETTAALQMIGSTVQINTSGSPLSASSPASWSLNSAATANANVTITSSTGQVAFTGTTTLNAGNNTYTWNGIGTNGVTWPAGNYTISVSATGANGQSVTVTPQVQGTVTAVNVNQFPPQVTVNGQTFSMSQINSIGASSTSSTLTNSVNSLTSSINSLLSLL
jgi:flagellar basal-body rod modification protein FlgD